MKKILLSLLMLCTAVSAWSYDTETVTKSSSQSTQGKITCGEFMIVGNLDKTTGAWTKGLAVYSIHPGCVITSVEFVMRSGSINQCECNNGSGNGKGNWKADDTGKWMQDGTFAYDANIAFSSSSSCLIDKVTITYHKHTFTHNSAKEATCMNKGLKEYWECSDCGRKYYDGEGAGEVPPNDDLILPKDPANHCGALEEHARVEASCIKEGHVQYWHCNLCNRNFKEELGIVEISSDEMILSIDPTKHASALTKHEEVPATCVSTGNVQYWHCGDCGYCFSDETGATQIAGDNVATDIDPTNHNGKLTEVAGKNASVIEEGILHHWHCEACGNDYADAGGNTDITGKTVKAKYDADAILIGMNEGKIIDDSFMLLPSTEETVTVATVTFEEDDTMILDIAGKGGEKTAYSINETNPLETSFAHTFKLKANQDPDHTDRYYSTFFTSEGAYKVPNTATAYTGTVEDGEEDGIDILALGAVEGVIPCGEAVIVRGSEKSITLMPSCKKLTPSDNNILEGTDDATILGADQYALSLGQHGVGFYLWDGKTIGANKAYLTLDEALGVKALQFRFDDEPGTTGINFVNENENENLYDLNGLRVGMGYKGIVIKNGKKVIR